MERPGVVILDATVIGHFEDPGRRERVVGSLRAASFVIVPTALNVLEVIRTGNEAIRGRLLDTLRALGGADGVLPLPAEVLSEVAGAWRKGEARAVTGGSYLTAVLTGEQDVGDGLVEAATAYTAGLDKIRRGHYDELRRVFASRVRGRDRPSAAEMINVLESWWLPGDVLPVYAESVWSALGLGEFPGVAPLLELPVWRTFFEAEGANLFEQAIQQEQPRMAGPTDLSQLVYLHASDRAILVTNDTHLERVGGALINGRRAQSTVESLTTFLRRH